MAESSLKNPEIFLVITTQKQAMGMVRAFTTIFELDSRSALVNIDCGIEINSKYYQKNILKKY